MSHNMVVHLIIIHFKNPELSSTTNIFGDYAGNITSIFICLLLLLLLFFCAFCFQPISFVVAQHYIPALSSLDWEAGKHLGEVDSKRTGELGTEGWVDERTICMSSHFLTECWRKEQWQSNHERAVWASNHSWQTTLKEDAPDWGSVCVCVYMCKYVCVQVPLSLCIITDIQGVSMSSTDCVFIMCLIWQKSKCGGRHSHLSETHTFLLIWPRYVLSGIFFLPQTLSVEWQDTRNVFK